MRKNYPKTWWNYRIIKRDKDEDIFFGIYEAYYNSEIEDKPHLISDKPVFALGNTPEELEKDLKSMKIAFEMDILTYEDFDKGKVDRS